MTAERSCEAFSRRCVPSVYVGPSGKRMRHAWDCPDKPGQPISAAEYAQGRTWPPRGRVRR